MSAGNAACTSARDSGIASWLFATHAALREHARLEPRARLVDQAAHFERLRFVRVDALRVRRSRSTCSAVIFSRSRSSLARRAARRACVRRMREAIGQRARADRFRGAECLPRRRRIVAAPRPRDRLRCAPRTARSSPTGSARAFPGSPISRGCAFRSRRRCRPPSPAPRTSPASSNASASAELVSMRLKSSCRRA